MSSLNSSNRLVIAVLVIAALAIGFWVLLLAPKRDRADKLGAQVEELQASVQEARNREAEAEQARRQFPADYRQLVSLGQAVPASDETSSLLVELNRVAERAKVKFDTFLLEGSGEESPPVTGVESPNTAPPSTGTTGSPNAIQASETVSPTEASASVMPLGASIGPAGLAVMPYSLSFKGNFFHIADFMHGIDSMVHTASSKLAVDGRLMTLDGFALSADAEREFPYLDANFKVTTYLVPPEQGITAGATEAAPGAVTTGAEAPAEASSEPVAAQ